MKKIVIFLAPLSIVFAENTCLIDYSLYKNLPESTLLKIAKNCKLKIKQKNLYIAKEKEKVINVTNKIIEIPNKNYINTYIPKTPKPIEKIVSKKNHSKPPVIKIDKKAKPKTLTEILKNKNLKFILNYAIKHNLINNKKISNLIIEKSKNYPQLDINYIKETFSQNYTKQDLKNLLDAIK